MATTLESPAAPPSAGLEPPPVVEKKSRWRLWTVLGSFVAWVVAYQFLKGKWILALATPDTDAFHNWLNSVKDSMDVGKVQGGGAYTVLGWVTDALNWVVQQLQYVFTQAPPGRLVPIIGWLGVVALVAWLAYVFAGLRLAVMSAVSILLCGFLGYYTDSIDTLIIVGVSVVICVVIRIPLGIWMSRSKAVDGVVTPVLDVMQTLPSFAYLAPLSLFFGIGSACAVVVTLVYAMPPIVRISCHGLRSVSPTTIEATTAIGSTSMQLLRNVQLPMAKRTIVVGLNQTILAALSMTVIAAFVSGPGLGVPVVQALQSLNIGVAFVAGLCIVILAIWLDRLTTAASERSDIAARSGRTGSRRIGLIVAAVVGVICLYLSNQYLKLATFPTDSFFNKLGPWVAKATTNVSNWIVDTFGTVTTHLSSFVSYKLLNPLQDLLTLSPWFITSAFILMLAIVLAGAGPRSTKTVVGAVLAILAVGVAGFWSVGAVDPSAAVTKTSWWVVWAVIVVLIAAATALGARGALLPTAVCLVIILGTGLWADSMVTLAMTLVATVITMLLGVVFGVWMGRSHRADLAIRPFLDALQTLPSLIYLIPALALFGATRFTAIFAAVLYGAPVAIKIIADGIRAVSPTTVEAAEAAGTSRWQMITKVQLPMARGATILAANQGLLFVLAVVVIGALVGGGGLGYLVVAGFVQASYFGKGLAAGIAIAAMGVMLDRITRYSAQRFGRTEA